MWVLDACSKDRPSTDMTLLLKMLMQRRVTAAALVQHGAVDLGKLGRLRGRGLKGAEKRKLQERALQHPSSVLKTLKKGSRVCSSPAAVYIFFVGIYLLLDVLAGIPEYYMMCMLLTLNIPLSCVCRNGRRKIITDVFEKLREAIWPVPYLCCLHAS